MFLFNSKNIHNRKTSVFHEKENLIELRFMFVGCIFVCVCVQFVLRRNVVEVEIKVTRGVTVERKNCPESQICAFGKWSFQLLSIVSLLLYLKLD